MTRGSILLLVAAMWTVTSVSVVLLLRRAARQCGDARELAYRLRCCAQGTHRDTLDTKVDGLPQLAWRCLDCDERVLLGTAFSTGTNRRTRRPA